MTLAHSDHMTLARSDHMILARSDHMTLAHSDHMALAHSDHMTLASVAFHTNRSMRMYMYLSPKDVPLFETDDNDILFLAMFKLF